MPSTRGLSSGSAPLPIRLCATGRDRSSANSSSSAAASAATIPPPTYSTGLSAPSRLRTISSATASSMLGLARERVLRDHLVEQGDVDLGREDVHRHVHENGSGTAALGEGERLVEHLGNEVGLVDAPRALDERPVDLLLGGVGVQVDLLVRVLAEVVGGHVAGDHHHRESSRGRRSPHPWSAFVRPGPRWVSTTPARLVTRA